MNKIKIAKLVAPLVALGMALTACGGDDSNSGASGDHNDQDVTFATEMIPHHAQAVQMAEMAIANAGERARARTRRGHQRRSGAGDRADELVARSVG